MTKYALSVNYDYCTGCHTCVVSCKMEHDIPEGQWGIKLMEIGPWEYGEGKWQDDYLPVPTAQCNRCAERVEKGKKPACVHNCYTNAMKFGPVEEVMAEIAADEKKFGVSSNHAVYLLK